MTSPRSRLRLLVRLGVLTAAVAAFSAVGASPALAQHVSCGQVITHSTHVKNDLLDCPGDGLVIGASNIKLDLGGHTIDGVNGAAADGINNKGGFDNVKVEHGTVQQFHIGLELNGADGNKLEHLTVTQNPFDGIRLTGSNNNTISHVDESASFDGIFTDAASTGNLLLKNHSNKNGHDGIHVDGTGNTITKNHADKNVNLGIFAFAGNVDGGKNTAHKNGNALQCVGVVCK